jgi:hypothetical protein
MVTNIKINCVSSTIADEIGLKSYGSTRSTIEYVFIISLTQVKFINSTIFILSRNLIVKSSSLRKNYGRNSHVIFEGLFRFYHKRKWTFKWNPFGIRKSRPNKVNEEREIPPFSHSLYYKFASASILRVFSEYSPSILRVFYWYSGGLS